MFYAPFQSSYKHEIFIKFNLPILLVLVRQQENHKNTSIFRLLIIQICDVFLVLQILKWELFSSSLGMVKCKRIYQDKFHRHPLRDFILIYNEAF